MSFLKEEWEANLVARYNAHTAHGEIWAKLHDIDLVFVRCTPQWRFCKERTRNIVIK